MKIEKRTWGFILAAGTFAIGIPAIQMSSIQYILNLSDNQNIKTFFNHKLGSNCKIFRLKKFYFIYFYKCTRRYFRKVRFYVRRKKRQNGSKMLMGGISLVGYDGRRGQDGPKQGSTYRSVRVVTSMKNTRTKSHRAVLGSLDQSRVCSLLRTL